VLECLVFRLCAFALIIEIGRYTAVICYRLRAARVLLIGVGGLGAEVAKNVVLAGVQSLTLLDDQSVCCACIFT